MKFALIDGEKEEATKGATALCQFCGLELIAKCGEIKIHHWAHKSKRNCDPWWENEGEWHRAWKNEFPTEWQEIIHHDENGQKHIADVKTQSGWTLEFQHSFLKHEERQSRNYFYKKLVWVIDGTRRKTDIKQFKRMLEESTQLRTNIPIIRASFPDECRLLNEWHNNDSLVFFDFNESEVTEDTMLWFLFPKTLTSSAYLSPFSRANFIELFNNDNFDNLYKNTILPIHKEISNGERRQREANIHNRANTLSGFDRYLKNKQRRRRRL
ncbi:MAG TPA: hypothetical protein ENI63_01420 [Candidatus Kaiserbacteria bacterium]|nr:hypothetical protein [Candidatus Kaiserbacteria bacterium]